MTTVASSVPSMADAEMPGDKLLVVDGVSVSLGGRPVLDQVSFEVGPGEFTGLIGSNGAGKTDAVAGDSRLAACRLGASQRRRPVRVRPRPPGRVRPQKMMVDADLPLRARDVIELGIDGVRFGLRRPSRGRRALVEELLAAVDAERFADARVGRLSGGEQQRVLIAHALASRPRLLLLDEPLANLDIASGHEIVALLAKIATEQQVAVVLSAHEMNPLLPVLDRVVYLAAGRAVAGRTDEVIRSDVLSRLYGYHVDVLDVHGRIIVVAGNGNPPGAVGPVGPVIDVG